MTRLALQEEGMCALKQGLVRCVGARPLHHRRCCCIQPAMGFLSLEVDGAGTWTSTDCSLVDKGWMLKDEGEASESSSCVLGGELEVTQELLYEF